MKKICHSLRGIRRAIYLALLSLSACGQEKPSGNRLTAQVAQTKTVGGQCDGCELIYTGMPTQITATDTAPDWHEPGTKLRVHGMVFRSDSLTPAPDIILYYYHTDATGHYAKRGDEQTQHGYIRGWVRTGANGRYSFYTNRPAPYPDRAGPAHIHLLVKEPQLNEYWVDELVFEDDSFLTEALRGTMENRGGSGILRTLTRDGLQSAEHNIILGKNIPGYPAKNH